MFVVAACVLTAACLAAWQENVRPKMYVQLGKHKYTIYIVYKLICKFIQLYVINIHMNINVVLKFYLENLIFSLFVWN